MPKKRSFNRYNKPPTTAPSSLASTPSPSLSSQHGTHSPNDENQETPNTVNDLLSRLRQSTARPNLSQVDLAIAPAPQPSLPPDISRLLQLHEPAVLQLPLRDRLRQNRNAPRPADGPPAPLSWRLYKGNRGRMMYDPAGVLEDDYIPARGSLVDRSLRRTAALWMELPDEFADMGLDLFYLPNHLREALIRALGRCMGKDFTLDMFKCIIAPRQDDGNGSNVPDDWDWNRDFTHLSIPPSLLTSTTFPVLISYLYPKRVESNDDVKESWDADDNGPPAPPRQLIPAITHLSLAIPPGETGPAPSWKHLLSMSKKLPSLTHLSLAYWPKPMRTPHAMNASVVGGPAGTVAYSGTTMYSHALDNDWSEAVHIIRQLSKSLYQLKHLDLTGCTSWFQALIGCIEQIQDTDADADAGFVRRVGRPQMKLVGTVDWVRDWGNMETIRMRSGLVVRGGDATGLTAADRNRLEEGIQLSTRLERIVTAHRGGKGKIITVEKDSVYDFRLPA